jgi:hypothetical protein
MVLAEMMRQGAECLAYKDSREVHLPKMKGRFRSSTIDRGEQ